MEIQASYVLHHNEKRIRLQFENYEKLNALVKHIPGAKWSKTLKSWHIPCNTALYHHFKNNLPEDCLLISKEKTNDTGNAAAIAAMRDKQCAAHDNIMAQPKVNIAGLHITNRQALQQYMQCLQLKAYTASTIKTYISEFSALLHLLKNKDVSTLTADDIKRYMLYCINTLHLTEHTLHSRINALKFYYEQVLHRDKFFFEIPRPKRPFQLPKLLNENELARLFNAIINKKHKAILFTAYSAGLRVSEVVNLKLSHIDSKRMQILVERSKNKKDRYVNLSPVLLDILRSYIKEYIPGPKEYLFESEQTGNRYPVRTIQQIFYTAKRKAGIKKEIGMHSLRHSFATHLLDRGTDIKYIKDLLGHFNIKTTERYLHVSKKQLVNIISPLDDLWKKENIEW